MTKYFFDYGAFNILHKIENDNIYYYNESYTTINEGWVRVKYSTIKCPGVKYISKDEVDAYLLLQELKK